MMKSCSTCKLPKAFIEFHRRSNKTDGYRASCKGCISSWFKVYGERPEVKLQRSERHKGRLREVRMYRQSPEGKRSNRKGTLKCHGLSLERYDQMSSEQNDVCKICRQKNRKGRHLVIDHDHKCCPGRYSCGNCVRGLLCDFCNVGLAMYRDDSELLKSAVLYLKEG